MSSKAASTADRPAGEGNNGQLIPAPPSIQNQFCQSSITALAQSYKDVRRTMKGDRLALLHEGSGELGHTCCTR